MEEKESINFKRFTSGRFVRDHKSTLEQLKN